MITTRDDSVLPQECRSLPVDAMRTAERELASQGERAYARSVADWQAQRKQKKGAGATAECASSGSSSDQAARQGSAPEPAL